MQQLGVLGVEPVEVERVGEEELGDRAGLRRCAPRTAGGTRASRRRRCRGPAPAGSGRPTGPRRAAPGRRRSQSSIARDRQRRSRSRGSAPARRAPLLRRDQQRLQAQRRCRRRSRRPPTAGPRRGCPTSPSSSEITIRVPIARSRRRAAPAPRSSRGAAARRRVRPGDRHRDRDRDQRRRRRGGSRPWCSLPPAAGRPWAVAESSSPSSRKTATRPTRRTSLGRGVVRRPSRARARSSRGRVVEVEVGRGHEVVVVAVVDRARRNSGQFSIRREVAAGQVWPTNWT